MHRDYTLRSTPRPPSLGTPRPTATPRRPAAPGLRQTAVVLLTAGSALGLVPYWLLGLGVPLELSLAAWAACAVAAVWLMMEDGPPEAP